VLRRICICSGKYIIPAVALDGSGREAFLPCAAVVMEGYPTTSPHTRTARGEGEVGHAENPPLATQAIQNLTHFVQSSPDQEKGLACFATPTQSLVRIIFFKGEKSLRLSRQEKARLRRELASFFVGRVPSPSSVPSCGCRFVG